MYMPCAAPVFGHVSGNGLRLVCVLSPVILFPYGVLSGWELAPQA